MDCVYSSHVRCNVLSARWTGSLTSSRMFKQVVDPGNNVGFFHGIEVGCLFGHWSCNRMYGHVMELWCIHSNV